jgi:hypothetical protein
MAPPGVTQTPTLRASDELTVTVASPVLVSTVARIVAVPEATAVTRPLEETVATLGLSDDHATTRPVNVFPLASRATAEAWVD